MQNFEPYHDFDEINDEMVDDLHADLLAYRRATDNFITEKTKENAAAVLESQRGLSETAEAVYHAIWRQPVMVHVAGPKKTETNPDDSDEQATVQRCTRCGSLLQMYQEGMSFLGPEGPRRLEEDDMPWWDEGDVVAKGNGHGSISMYEVEKDRDLEKHEHTCVALNELDLTA